MKNINITRKNFLTIALSTAGLTILNACGKTDTTDNAPIESGDVDKTGNTDNTGGENTPADDEPKLSGKVVAGFTFPEDCTNEHKVGFNTYSAAPADCPNLRIHACLISLGEYESDSNRAERIYMAEGSGFDESDVFEHFADYVTQETGEADYRLIDLLEAHDERVDGATYETVWYALFGNYIPVVDSSEMVKVGDWDMEHVTGRFHVDTLDVYLDEGYGYLPVDEEYDDSFEIPFAAYAVMADDKVCFAMASDAVAGDQTRVYLNSIEDGFGDIRFENYGVDLGVETLDAPTQDQLEEWALKLAETFSTESFSK